MQEKLLHQFGFEALGPVTNMFFLRLHAHITQCARPDTKLLFASRSGHRMKDCYNLWLSHRGMTCPVDEAVLRVSRMMAIKAAYGSRPELALAVLERELPDTSLESILRRLLSQEISASRVSDFPACPQASLASFLGTADYFPHFVRNYLNTQSKLYGAYLSKLAGEAKRLILVDTGWRGTSQLLLENAYPSFEWVGLYFGCIGRRHIGDASVGRIHGLIFDSAYYRPGKPETSFIVHRHLIESLFEPGIPTVDQIDRDSTEAWMNDVDYRRAELRVDWDTVYDGVCDYLAAYAADPVSAMHSKYITALERLERVVCYPTYEDLTLVGGKYRSGDMGGCGATAPVLPPQNRFEGDSAALRIRDSLWRAGQAVVEYPAEQIRAVQERILNGFMAPSEGTLSEAWIHPSNSVEASGRGGHVAIITRTKARPILLKRAAESISSQTYHDYTWVIVNDGGELNDVLHIVEASGVDPSKVTICSNAESLGMEAASNIGIRSSQSDYIAIHDDDDTWHPDFLLETVKWMGVNGHLYSGVITKTLYISEEVVGNNVVEYARKPYNGWLECVHLSEVLVNNIFPPIAFLFNRESFIEVGGFNEQLPVLGDWDFNIRFLMKYDIGLLPKVLSYYHHRDTSLSESAYSNSVVAVRDKHAAYHAVIRNKYIRQSASEHASSSLSSLMGMGYLQQSTRSAIDMVRNDLYAAINEKRVSSRTHNENQLNDLLKIANKKIHSLQLELDRRWVLLYIACTEILRSRNLDEHPVKLISMFEESMHDILKNIHVDSPPDFNEAEYYKIYADVYENFIKGETYGAFDHYFRFGIAEMRERPTLRSVTDDDC